MVFNEEVGMDLTNAWLILKLAGDPSATAENLYLGFLKFCVEYPFDRVNHA